MPKKRNYDINMFDINEINKTIGKNVKILRLSKDLTQEQMQRLSGLRENPSRPLKPVELLFPAKFWRTYPIFLMSNHLSFLNPIYVIYLVKTMIYKKK